ncbi:MAG: double-strand break repair helicase AddA [Neomegalonema sp.]|nr:double-strand break repair helicase AddA [Neomegalonema sp.]
MTVARRQHPPAAAAQIAAARPEASVWVSANAGSGKTRVLTTRVARLLLAGAQPGRILCLTYTKAAAAEMQTRLYKMLGGWAMAEDVALERALDGVLGEDEPPVSPEDLAEARRLFARALETPGGLKIQTIHAFCESLLSRFPLEAGVSPHFGVADDLTSAELINEARDQVMRDRSQDPELAAAIDIVLNNAGAGAFDELTREILSLRSAYMNAGGREELAALLRIAPDAAPDQLRAEWARGLDRSGLAELGEFFIATGKPKLLSAGRALKQAAAAQSVKDTLHALGSALLTQTGEVRSAKGFPAKADMKNAPWVEGRVLDLLDSFADLQQRATAAEMLQRSDALRIFATALIARYGQGKAVRATLDFDDLVNRAVDLLTRSEARDWVRYKLDGGVEHILVDEAQDTSPEQWRAVAALAEEFFAGDGAEREEDRPAPTVFAVGDEKQSIYSFQGAAPELLSQKGAIFAEHARAAGRVFDQSGLATSFRSAPAILSFVDRVFEPKAARTGLVFTDPEVRHIAFKKAPGMVELWPPLSVVGAGEEPPWDAPIDMPAADNPKAQLAEIVAETIHQWIDREPLPSHGRKIRPGDILVLVRKRGALSTGIIKGLKARGTPVAGADRLSLAKEIAAKDLLALAEFCLFPEDDLALATLLRSPFCDVDEEALFDLAHYRPGRRPLYFALQHCRADRPEFEAAYQFLQELIERADYLRPYELFALALGPRGGRRRMVARLGAEAEDPIDEFLSEALRFETAGRPTLQAFAMRLAATGEASIKRENEQGRDEVRIMTAHGSKGLEAPVVVIPDTTDAPGSGGRSRLLNPAKFGGPPAAPIWLGPRKRDPEPVVALREAAAAREAEEHRRLLYVALTRAEDRLLICGAPARGRKVNEESWYALCQAALRGPDGETVDSWPQARVEAAPSPIPGAGETLLQGARIIGDGDPKPPQQTAAAAETSIQAPDWLFQQAAMEVAPPDVSPSDLGGEDPEPLSKRRGGSGLGREAAALRGEAIHFALEKAAGLVGEDRRAAVRAIIARAPGGFSERIRQDMAAEAIAVLEDPAFAAIFGPNARAEADLTAVLPELGPGEIHGRIDRILIEPDRVLIVDFKTGGAPEAPPEGYLRQLSVYVRAVAKLYPDRPVEAALLWTADRRLEHISESALDAAFARAAAELDRRKAGA